MKNASGILSHIIHWPQFRFLKQQRCYRKYIEILPLKYQKAIAFVYIKEDTLFVALTHPGFKMELNYNKNLLKSLLTQLGRYDNACSMLKASKVVIFHSKYHPVKQVQKEISSIPYYNETASGSFEIQSDDPELIEKFKTLKQHIKCNK